MRGRLFIVSILSIAICIGAFIAAAFRLVVHPVNFKAPAADISAEVLLLKLWQLHCLIPMYLSSIGISRIRSNRRGSNSSNFHHWLVPYIQLRMCPKYDQSHRYLPRSVSVKRTLAFPFFFSFWSHSIVVPWTPPARPLAFCHLTSHLIALISRPFA
jgi:hypothetical protein